MTESKSEPVAPKHPFPTEEFDPFLLADDDDWLQLEPVLTGENGEMVADGLCHLIFDVIHAIELGEAERATYTLKDAVRIFYKYTRAHRLSLQLYYRSLSGELLSADEPEPLIAGALERAGIQIENEPSGAEAKEENE